MASDTQSEAVDLESEIRYRVLHNDPLLVLPPAAALMVDSDAPALRYGFRIGGVALLVPQGIATEVLDRPTVFPLPRAPRWLAGMLNMRGNVVPLFNIAELLASPARWSDTQRILVLGQATRAVAVYVDDLPKPLSVTAQGGTAADVPAMLRPFVEPAFCDQDLHWCEFQYEEFFRHLSSSRQEEVEHVD